MTEQKQAGSEVIVTLSTEVLGGQMVVQFALPKDADFAAKNAQVDEIRRMVERQMAFGELDKAKLRLATDLKNAETCRARINDIETAAKMAYAINGGNKRGDVKYSDAQQKGLHLNYNNLEDLNRQITAARTQIEKCERLIEVRT
jgi:hypothetical protein